MGINDNTFTPSLHLVPFCRHLHKYAVFVSCVQRRVVEGSGVGSGGCVVHFDVHDKVLILSTPLYM